MHLDPTTATATRPGDTTIQHGALGSDARLAVLRYLANRPLGAPRNAIATAIGLDATVTIYVLTALRQAGRVVCDGRGAKSIWFVPCARVALGPSALARLREQAAALEQERA